MTRLHSSAVNEVCKEFMGWLEEPACTGNTRELGTIKRVHACVLVKMLRVKRSKAIETVFRFILAGVRCVCIEIERLVKSKRISKPSQLSPIRSNLKFVFSVLIQNKVCTPSSIALSLFTELETVKVLYRAMEQRNVGASRKHAVFLLVKKIIVYLSAEESLRLKVYNPPTVYPSFKYCSSICSDSTVARKARTNDKLVGDEEVPNGVAIATSSSSTGSSTSPGKVFAASVPMSKVEMQSLAAGCFAIFGGGSVGRSHTGVV